MKAQRKVKRGKPAIQVQVFKPKPATTGRPVRVVSLIDQEDRRSAQHMREILAR